MPYWSGLQERDVVCHARRRVGPRGLRKVEGGVRAVTTRHDEVVSESDHEAHSSKAQPDFATTAKGAQDKAKTDEPTDEYDRGLGLRGGRWAKSRLTQTRL